MRKKTGFASWLSPNGRAVLFALKIRMEKKARRASGWAAIALLTAPWLLSGLVGVTFGLLCAPALVVWAAEGIAHWHREPLPAALVWCLPAAPFACAAGIAMVVRFLWGAPSTSFKRRRGRFDWLASDNAQNAFKSAWPVIEREGLWTAERVKPWAKGVAHGLVESIFAFGVGFWGFLVFVIAIGCVPIAIFAALVFWGKKKLAALKLAKKRIASAIEALREEGAEAFARAEKEQLGEVAAQTEGADGAIEENKKSARRL